LLKVVLPRVLFENAWMDIPTEQPQIDFLMPSCQKDSNPETQLDSYMLRISISAGKTKIVYPAENSEDVVLFFKDDVTAGDGQKRAVLAGKGSINASVTAKLFRILEDGGLRTHFIRQLNPNELLVKRLEMIPIEVVCRLLAAGHMIGLGKYFQHREKLKAPIVEFYLKDDSLHDPLVNHHHIKALGLATSEELFEIESTTIAAGKILQEFFEKKDILLVDFKLEFGRDKSDRILIGDELGPDSMRLWDKSTYEILDKDRFRKDLPNVFELAYQEPFRRICCDDYVPSSSCHRKQASG